MSVVFLGKGGNLEVEDLTSVADSPTIHPSTDPTISEALDPQLEMAKINLENFLNEHLDEIKKNYRL